MLSGSSPDHIAGEGRLQRSQIVRKELELKIANRWPGWFDLNGDPRRTSMCFGFAHGGGWFDLVWGLCEQIEQVIGQGHPFEVFQVKEKMGGLHFYTMDPCPDEVDRLIDVAGEESVRTCEVCGQPGRWDGEGWEGERWVKTRCDQHLDVDGPLS
jgi:hypothetical protein